MSTKPKRIKAHHYYSDREGICYVIKQSDIRALAEQLQKDYHNAWFDGTYDKKYPNAKTDSMLYALRFAGMTPGEARAK